jgi:hypothetical protein
VTDRINNDLAALLTPAPSKGVQFSQGKIITWDRVELHNTIEWRGITLTDVPLIEGINNLTLKPGDVVGLMGWAPENAKGVGTWWIIGKLSNPGEFISDLTFYLGQIRFLTNGEGYNQVYIGLDSNGNPLTILYYGDAASTRALQVANRNWIKISDPHGNEIFGNDAASEYGISRPYLNIPLVPSSGTSVGTGGPFWPQFTNAAYQEVLHGITTLWHPRIAFSIATSVTAGAVDWELRIDGTTIGTGSGTGGSTFSITGWGTTFTVGQQVSVQVFCRNTSGTASRVIADRCYGTQS